tara:strand:- start:791 stop:1792 length:1002 start_codon:yes stop_codon:yes gene_type:complete
MYKMRDSAKSWQKNLAHGFRSSKALLQYLDIHAHASCDAEVVFATRVPKHFADLMEKGNPDDPLLLQVLATNEELETHASFIEDPLQEQSYNKTPGVIHKYHGRVLLVLTGACAINCRYCFRRHFSYESNNPGSKNWGPIIDEIAKDSSISEIILSGGDPLLASDELLRQVVDKIETETQIKTLRIHTRMPVVLPERINENIQTILSQSRLNKVVVLHSNHPNELSDAVFAACQKLKQSGCHLLNQSVLLKKINDDSETLVKLSHRLFEIGVLPYYLHLLDKVRGVQHFHVPTEKAQQIFAKIQARLPGYLVPRLAVEIPGKSSKTLIHPSLS